MGSHQSVSHAVSDINYCGFRADHSNDACDGVERDEFSPYIEMAILKGRAAQANHIAPCVT